MTAYYFDTSGLVKRYVAETGTAWVTALMDPAAGNLLHVANLFSLHPRQKWANARITDLLKLLQRFNRVPWADDHAVQMTRIPPLGGFVFDFVHADHKDTTLRVSKR